MELQYLYNPLHAAASPSVKNVEIIGPAVEGMTIKGTGEYFGGSEGISKLDWLREDLQLGYLHLLTFPAWLCIVHNIFDIAWSGSDYIFFLHWNK